MQKGARGYRAPFLRFVALGLAVDRRAPAAPNVDRSEQEQPHHIDKVPIPSGGFKTEMLLGCEMPFICADQAYDQEDCPHKDVEAVETRRHVEGRAIVQPCERER
jgi:hypothetical protein